MFVRSIDSGKIRNISVWLEAFHVFVAIYCSKFPAEIGHLMTYAQIVQGISKSSGDDVALTMMKSLDSGVKLQFSILMLCAKYQEAGLCGSQEKCDRNYLVSKFAYVKNIQSRSNRKRACRRFKTALHDTVLHTDALCQISGSCMACVVPEKNVTEIIL